MELSLANNVAYYPTSQDLWNVLLVTYTSENDSLQVFDMHNRVAKTVQRRLTLEDFWLTIQSL